MYKGKDRLNKPLISIITPSYNHELFIAQCIESALAQTFPDWEMIIIDDASKDKTPYIIEKYAKLDRRIKFIKHSENWGIYRLGDTYNQALDLAQGEFIAILEGDDFWPIDKLEKQLPNFKKSEIVLSWGRVAFTDDQRQIFGIFPTKSFKKDVIRNRPKGRILKELLFSNIIPAVSVICRKETLLSIGGFQHRLYLPYVDYPSWLMMSLKGEFYFINDIVGYWRVHPEQSTEKMRRLQIKGGNNLICEFFPLIPVEIKNKYNFTIEKIIRWRKGLIANNYFFKGRINLCKREWEKAKQNFRIAYKKGTFFIKFKASFGLVLSYNKIDFEFLIGIKNKFLK